MNKRKLRRLKKDYQDGNTISVEALVDAILEDEDAEGEPHPQWPPRGMPIEVWLERYMGTSWHLVYSLGDGTALENKMSDGYLWGDRIDLKKASWRYCRALRPFPMEYNQWIATSNGEYKFVASPREVEDELPNGETVLHVEHRTQEDSDECANREPKT